MTLRIQRLGDDGEPVDGTIEVLGVGFTLDDLPSDEDRDEALRAVAANLGVPDAIVSDTASHHWQQTADDEADSVYVRIYADPGPIVWTTAAATQDFIRYLTDPANLPSYDPDRDVTLGLDRMDDDLAYEADRLARRRAERQTMEWRHGVTGRPDPFDPTAILDGPDPYLA